MICKDEGRVVRKVESNSRERSVNRVRETHELEEKVLNICLVF